jgi:FolB domain-containing protein
MTRMLASVGSLREAEIALDGGADIIDLKYVGSRAAGVMKADAIRSTVAAIGRRRSVSAFTGDPQMRPGQTEAAAQEFAATGLDYIKVGIFPGGDAPACIGELAGIASRVKLIAVFFADASPDLSLVPLLKRSGFAGAMLDTQGEAAGHLLDHFNVSRLLRFVEDCHEAGLLAGLAGSLEMPDIPRLLVLTPDLMGFHSALCNSRGAAGAVDLGCIQAVRALIPLEGPEPGQRDVDYRLLAARARLPSAVGGDVPVDLVFVHDLVLPVFIGAYARERDAPQNVRFAVTASVMRNGRVAEDMRDVFSYDLITDGIRMLIGSGHVALVETLAERIAVMVLTHPRVTKVIVRVQKLETGSGTVGVEIERTRTVVRAIDRLVVPLLAGGGGQF